MAPLTNAAVAVLAVLATVCDTGKYSQYYNSEAQHEVTITRALCYIYIYDDVVVVFSAAVLYLSIKARMHILLHFFQTMAFRNYTLASTIS